jgi:hypothetical protein
MKGVLQHAGKGSPELHQSLECILVILFKNVSSYYAPFFPTGLIDRVIIEQGLASQIIPGLKKRYGSAQFLFEVCLPCRCSGMLHCIRGGKPLHTSSFIPQKRKEGTFLLAQDQPGGLVVV